MWSNITSGSGLFLSSGDNTADISIASTGNVGIGTAGPQDKLQIDTSMTFHSGGHKVIGFGWSPSIGQALMTGYPAEIRWNSTDGILSLGIDSTSRTAGQIPTVSDILNIKSGNVGIGTTVPRAKFEIAGGGDLLFTGSPEDPGDVVFQTVTGSEKGRIWSRPSSGSGLYISGGDLIPDITIDSTGNVGIGTTQPTFGRLAIEHSAVPLSLRETDVAVDQGGLWRMPLDGGVLRFDVNTGTPGNEFGSNFRTVLAMNSDGSVEVPVIRILGGADIAEPFDVKDAEAIRPGMVVAIDPEQPGNLRIADKSYDRTVAGIVSGANGINPGLVMKDEGTEAVGSHPVALTGRVYTWVDTSYGSIQPGDLLTTSDTPGHAMKVNDHAKAQGAIIGKAMSSLKEGKGLVLVLVTLQ